MLFPQTCSVHRTLSNGQWIVIVTVNAGLSPQGAGTLGSTGHRSSSRMPPSQRSVGRDCQRTQDTWHSPVAFTKGPPSGVVIPRDTLEDTTLNSVAYQDTHQSTETEREHAVPYSLSVPITCSLFFTVHAMPAWVWIPAPHHPQLGDLRCLICLVFIFLICKMGTAVPRSKGFCFVSNL